MAKPLALTAAVLLVAIGAWALVTSQGSGTPRTGAAAPGQSPTASSAATTSASSAAQSSSTESTSKSSSSSSPSATRHTTSTAPTHTVTSTAASTSAGLPPVPASSTGPLLPASYHRLQNAATGDCLAQPAGSAGVAHQGCADVKGQGWDYTVPLTGILGAVTGQEELVNGDSGNCLTGGPGGLGVKSCSADMAQLWTKTGGSGGATQLQNAADLLCLKASGGSVTEAPCDGSPGEMWSEGGTP
jgi:hypothetical protein